MKYDEKTKIFMLSSGKIIQSTVIGIPTDEGLRLDDYYGFTIYDGFDGTLGHYKKEGADPDDLDKFFTREEILEVAAYMRDQWQKLIDEVSL